MSPLLIPAIDLKDGRCVRLRQGRMDEVTVFSDDPVAMARHWAEQGCRRLHLVDLDGAVDGVPRNRPLIEAITRAVAGVEVQVGGGIRELETIEAYFDAGVAAAIVGTRAIEDPDFLDRAAARFPGRLILGLDARQGQLAVAGWGESSERTAVELAVAVSDLDLGAIVYTDIERDGMLSGVNVAATVALAQATPIPVIASGGVTDLTDVQRLIDGFAASSARLFGAITGRAIYSGSLDLRAGQALFDRAA